MKHTLILIFIALYFSDTLYAQQRGTGDKTTAAEIATIPKAPDLQTRDILNLPIAYSLKIYCPPVGNQGKYSTCTAWSSTYAAKTIGYAIKKRLTNKDSLLNYSFSQAFTYYFSKKATDKTCDSGASILKAVMVLRDTGAVFNYLNIPDCVPGLTDSVFKKASAFKIKSFQALCNYKEVNKDVVLKVKKSIADKKPVVISFSYFTSLDKVDSLTGYWINDSTDIPHQETEDRHSMCIVGYDDTVNGGSFEVMNSWGESWGRKGFFWLSYKQFMDYCLYAIELTE